MRQFLRTSIALLCCVVGMTSKASGADPLETRALIHTSDGDMTFVLWPTVAPITVLNFIKLSQERFYDGTSFHRVMPKFVIQGGDPMSRTDSLNVGTGGPSYCIPGEFSQKHHVRGTLSMARRSSDCDSAGSQFFVCLDEIPMLDGHYAAFGQLIDGWDVLDKIGNVPVVFSPQGERSRPLDRISITSISTELLVSPSPRKEPAVSSPESSAPSVPTKPAPSAVPNVPNESNPPVATSPTNNQTTDNTAASKVPEGPLQATIPQEKSVPDAPAPQAKSAPDAPAPQVKSAPDTPAPQAKSAPDTPAPQAKSAPDAPAPQIKSDSAPSAASDAAVRGEGKGEQGNSPVDADAPSQEIGNDRALDSSDEDREPRAAQIVQLPRRLPLY